MFTGIITDIGRIRSVTAGRDAKRFEVECAYDADGIAVGASIAHAGCCLTVTDKGALDGGRSWFAVEISEETLAKTTLGGWEVGTPVNLERALKVGDELGGHVVSGHVDGIGAISERRDVRGSVRFRIIAPRDLAPMIAPKGSITVDGVSLTVNFVDQTVFEVNIIPHTRETTTLGDLQPGTRVNLEIDLVARYLARLMEMRA